MGSRDVDLSPGTSGENSLNAELRAVNEALLVSNVSQHELTEQAQKAEALVESQKQLLERLLRGEPIESLLDFLAGAMERQAGGGLVVAIHLLEPDGYRFGYVAAPSLPAKYAEATRGMDARLELGCCSSAVVSHTPTVVRDFAAETRWPAFTAEMLAIGLRGCFTTPILSPDNQVLGTFAIYYREPRDPSPHDQQLVDVVTSTVALAIERKQAEQDLSESEERFRMVADNIAQLAWTCARLGHVTWYNQRWYDYTGLTFEDMQGWGWRQVQHPDHVDRVVEGVERAAETGEVWEDTFPLRGRDGSYRSFLSRAVPIRDAQGNIIRWFGTNTDVTEQLAAEEALRVADHRKNDFLAMLAHELRNPLAPLRNAAQIARVAGGDSPTIQAAADIMERQVTQLVRLVDDLLDVSRINRDLIALRKERAALASVVHHAVEAAGPQHRTRDQELTVTVPSQPLYVHGDPARLAQVVGNLLSNAAKFTDQSGHIWLTVEQEGAHAVIRVRDTGIGIADDQLQRIFEMFTQLDVSIGRTQGGLGLGLSLVRRLVELHDGTVDAHSGGIGKGSEFVVRLPLLPAESPAREAQPPPAAPAGSVTTHHRILVVDDNRDAAESLGMLLELAGYEVHLAYDGEHAQAAAETIRPDVVFLDIGLPKVNGRDVARHIRAQPWGPGVVLVALSGWGRDEDRRHSLDAGFDHHLVKPVDSAEITELLASLPAIPRASQTEA